MTPTQLLQQCKDEVAVSKGHENFKETMHIIGRPSIVEICDEAALLFAKKMCEKQREIDAENAKTRAAEVYNRITDESRYEICIDKDSILNAPLATEE